MGGLGYGDMTKKEVNFCIMDKWSLNSRSAGLET